MDTIEIPPSLDGQPTWAVATLFPEQGSWTDCDYLALNTNRLVELADCRLEVLPMPTELHQLIVAFLYESLRAWTKVSQTGVCLFSPMRVRVADGKFREPDVVFLLDRHDGRRQSKFWDGADLVMEVVSEDDPHRDLVSKRHEYATAGIREYWIVDPRDRSIIILTLDVTSMKYVESVRFTGIEVAASLLLSNFQIVADDAFVHD